MSEIDTAAERQLAYQHGSIGERRVELYLDEIDRLRDMLNASVTETNRVRNAAFEYRDKIAATRAEALEEARAYIAAKDELAKETEEINKRIRESGPHGVSITIPTEKHKAYQNAEAALRQALAK